MILSENMLQTHPAMCMLSGLQIGDALNKLMSNGARCLTH